MAIVTPPTRSRNLAEAHQKVRSPLARLRGYIRAYVSLEGVAALALFLLLWFWIGLFLDYGLFKFFTWDWVQETPWSFRLVVLLVLVVALAAVVALKVVGRLLREFRDPALALVLERRFPGLLGDRLITAVELSDPQQAAQLGYSPAMVRETIHEAAARVEQLPLREVFDWKRLYRRAIVLIIVPLAGYLLLASAFSVYNSVASGRVDLDGFSEINPEVAGIWFERNILLRDTIWPRKAYLELIGFPEGGEVRIAQGAPAPALRVRAFKYIIAGAPSGRAVAGFRAWLQARGEDPISIHHQVERFARPTAEGWRALTWFDLNERLLGAPVPQVNFPADWKPRDEEPGLTLDLIDLKLDKQETHATLNPDTWEKLRGVLARLDERVAEPGMRRTLRKLAIPDMAVLIYKGRTTSSRNTLQKVADNEYSGEFGELRESVSFWVQGEDYFTARRSITVVEQPALESLVREEERPAYLYYRPSPGGRPDELAGQRQKFEPANVSVQGGEVSRIDVPAGTNLVLTARATKDLQAVEVLPRKEGHAVRATPAELLDARTFRTRLENVRQEQGLLLKFTDTDGVVGFRPVQVMPLEDRAPRIKELAPDDCIRKVKEGYLVAVGARIPFKGSVEDDHGLSDVRYAYTVARADSLRQINVRSLLAAGVVPLMAPGGSSNLLGVGYLAAAARAAERSQEPEGKGNVKYVELPRFREVLREAVLADGRPEFLSLEMVKQLLGRRQQEPFRTLTRTLAIKPDEWIKSEGDPRDWLKGEEAPLACDFPLWRANLRAEPSKVQPRYKVELWLEARDTDVEGVSGKDGPGRLNSPGEKFTFLVVSEPELLSEIAKEEELKYADLDEMFKKVLEAQTKLVQTNLDLSDPRVKADTLAATSARADQITEVLEKCQQKTRDVFVAYERILRELRTNQVDPDISKRVHSRIVRPLAQIVEVEFDRTRDAVVAYRRAVDAADPSALDRMEAARKAGADAKTRMRELTSRINDVLGAMQGLTDINKLIRVLRDIEAEEQKQYDVTKQLYMKLIQDLLGEDEDDVSRPKKK